MLSAQQSRIKDGVAAIYGDLIHEGKQLDLVCTDIEAFLNASQRRVSGHVRFTLRPGNLFRKAWRWLHQRTIRPAKVTTTATRNNEA